MGIVDNALIGASGQGGYFLTNSLRVRSSASAYLSRTPSVSSSQSRYTMSFWVKRGALNTTQTFFSCYSAASYQTYFQFNSSNQLEFYNAWGSDLQNFVTTQVFRDPSAWYHIVIAVNMAAALSTNTVLMYVNGVQITAFSTFTYTNVFQATAINSTNAHNIARNVGTSSSYSDFYLDEWNFVNDQQLLPSSFGSTNPVTGVWQPRKYSGTYGTNGFYLPFTDNSALTTSSNVGLGRDYSGNGNYWTTNNISITAGVTYDSMTDVPTLTSATAANFCAANPLDKQTDIAVAQGNLQISTSAGAGNKQIRGSIALPSTGKFYWETRNTGSANNFSMGLTTTTASLSSEGAGDILYNENGIINNNGTTTSGFSTLALNDIVGVAVDVDANKIYFYKNNTLVNSGGTTINISAPFAPMFGLYDNGNAQSITFGQRPFAYTPPTGFVALNTFNLPTSTIVKGNTVMDATLWTGNGTSQTITNSGSMKPDFFWIKSRSVNGYYHVLTDSVRGITKALYSNATDAENTLATRITAINSNGFSLGTSGDVNDNAQTFVGWQWQAGQGTTSTNTNGSITSTVSVNASAGFSVVTYTGTGANATVGHGLGVAPQMMIFKIRNAVDGWGVYHVSMGNTQTMYLESTSAAVTSSTYWNNTSPTSSVFSLGTWGRVNNSGNTYVAYCFAPIAGFNSFGSYTGNGSADGPFIYTGFRPKFVMVKVTSTTNWWIMFDSTRNPYNAANFELAANLSDAEYTATTGAYTLFDFLSNGFKLRTGSLEGNSNGQTYIYMAFAENPFKNALAR